MEKAWKDIPKHQQGILIFIAMALIAWGGMLLFGSVSRGIKDNERRLSQTKAERQDLELSEFELEGGKVEVALKEEMRQLDRFLPQIVDAELLLKNIIANYSRERDIEFLLVQPQNVLPGEMSEAPDGSAIYGPSTLPVNIELVASYAELVRYLDYIESQDWLLSTEALAARLSDDYPEKLDVALTFDITLAATQAKAQSASERHRSLAVTKELVVDGKTIGNLAEVVELPFVPILQEGAVAHQKQEGALASMIPFTIDGLMGRDIVIDGEFYREGDVVEGWTITTIDLSHNQVHFLRDKKESVLRIEQ